MDKHAPEISQLRLDIEKAIDRKVRTPYDFELLANAIWERLHENLSPTTQLNDPFFGAGELDKFFICIHSFGGIVCLRKAMQR